MKVSYKGQNNGFKFRLAEVSFKEENMPTMVRIQKLLGIKGWNLDIVTDGYAQCVVSDMNEYQEFMEDWKEAKRCIRNCEKFGF